MNYFETYFVIKFMLSYRKARIVRREYMLIGYMRPYQEDLNCEIQLKKLKEINCDTIIKEDHSSAKKRIQLKNMLSNLNQGDKIVVTKLFTLADSTRHLVELLEVIDTKIAYFQTLTEGIDTSIYIWIPFQCYCEVPR